MIVLAAKDLDENSEEIDFHTNAGSAGSGDLALISAGGKGGYLSGTWLFFLGGSDLILRRVGSDGLQGDFQAWPCRGEISQI